MSCDALAKGFDVPDVRVCILCRPLRKSLTTHIQQLGRVMRSAPGKDKALVLDHTGNCLRFLNDTLGFWANGVDQLDEGAEKDRGARTVTKTGAQGAGVLRLLGDHPARLAGLPGLRPRAAPQAIRGDGRERRHATAAWARSSAPRKFDFDNHPILHDHALALPMLPGLHDAAQDAATWRPRRKWAAGIFKGVYGRWPPRTLR